MKKATAFSEKAHFYPQKANFCPAICRFFLPTNGLLTFFPFRDMIKAWEGRRPFPQKSQKEKEVRYFVTAESPSYAPSRNVLTEVRIFIRTKKRRATDYGSRRFFYISVTNDSYLFVTIIERTFYVFRFR